MVFDLVPEFRFVHEPLSSGDGAIPSLGHQELREALRERLDHSAGGAFLIGGFRGAGKTTMVTQVLDELKDDSPQRTYAIIRMNVARPVQPAELLYGIMRRLFETLDEQGLLARLPAHVRSAIVLSYLRTTVSLAAKRADATETTRSAGVSVSALPAPLATWSPKLERSTKKTRSAATEIAFLTYGEADVEHDFLRIIRLLADCPLPRQTLWQRLRGQVDPPIHVIVVLDELDKLSSSLLGLKCLDDILASLKNVLSTRGLHVLFVAGTDLLDRAAADSQQGNAIFESMFAWTAYVPAMWGAPRNLLTALVVAPDNANALNDLDAYLEYKSRGGPRRLFQELNTLIRWSDGLARIRIDQSAQRRFSFYARLNRVMTEHLNASEPESQPTLAADRFRLGAYYVLDWVLRTEGTVFKVQDVLSGPTALSSHLGISERRVSRLLETLVEESILYDPRDQTSPFSTVIGDSPTAGETQYRLTKSTREDLVAIAAANPDERAELFDRPSPPLPGLSRVAPQAPPAPAPGSPAWGDDPYGLRPAAPPPSYGQPPVPPDRQTTNGGPTAPPSVILLPGDAVAAAPHVGGSPTFPARFVGGGRYELIDVLGSGGMGTVYRGHDINTSQEVAVKVLPASAGADQSLRARFLRESQIAQRLRIPGVVRTRDVFQEPDGRMVIVMDLVRGRSLAELVSEGLSTKQAVRIAAQLLETVDLLHKQALVRFDIKPGNVIIGPDSLPVMVDLGLARPLAVNALADEITLVGSIIGTPAFMAPEQISGAQIDGRVDIYAVGALLYVMLGGDLAGGNDSPEALIMRRLTEDHLATRELVTSSELRAFIERATARRPEDRFPDAASARRALEDVPEAS